MLVLTDISRSSCNDTLVVLTSSSQRLSDALSSSLPHDSRFSNALLMCSVFFESRSAEGAQHMPGLAQLGGIRLATEVYRKEPDMGTAAEMRRVVC